MNLCSCCRLRLPQMDLKTPYIRLGVTERLSEMLEECFKIRLFLDNEDDCGICEVCVGRLRDASDFKLQVQRSQAELRSTIESVHVKNNEPVVKLEVPDGEVTDKGDIWLPILESKLVPPAPSRPESTTGNLTACSENRDNFEIRAKVTSKCDSFENQFSIFCLNSDQPKRRKRTNGPYSSVKCPAVLSTKALQIDHKSTHKKKKEHSCDVCSKKFKKNHKLIEHLRSHTGEKPFSCEICNKKFTLNNSLMAHRRIHTGNVFICDICNKQYIRKYDLILHMRAHTGFKPFKCEICNMRFSYRTSLHAHKSIHNGIKPFTCHLCGKQFKRKDHLKSHSLGHSGEKPYSCEICDKKFTAKSHVKRHKLKVHTQKNV